MKNTTITIILCLFLILSSSTNLFGFREYCADKWPNDYKMQEHCFKQQLEAAIESHKLLDHYGIGKLMEDGKIKLYPAPAGGEYRTIYINCLMKWKPDRTMVLHCFKEQIEAYERMKKRGG